jgi:hypothetical protein
MRGGPRVSAQRLRGAVGLACFCAAKRVNYGKNGVEFPFGPGWNALFGVQTADGDAVRRWTEAASAPASVATEPAATESKAADAAAPWAPRWKVRWSPLSAGVGEDELVFVRLRLLRGTVDHNSMVVLPTSADMDAWRARGPDGWSETIIAEEPLRGAHAARERQTVGYVTYGMQSFVRGRGFAVGLCHAGLLARAAATREACGTRQPVVLLRSVSSLAYVPALVSLLPRMGQGLFGGAAAAAAADMAEDD